MVDSCGHCCNFSQLCAAFWQRRRLILASLFVVEMSTSFKLAQSKNSTQCTVHIDCIVLWQISWILQLICICNRCAFNRSGFYISMLALPNMCLVYRIFPRIRRFTYKLTPWLWGWKISKIQDPNIRSPILLRRHHDVTSAAVPTLHVTKGGRRPGSFTRRADSAGCCWPRNDDIGWDGDKPLMHGTVSPLPPPSTWTDISITMAEDVSNYTNKLITQTRWPADRCLYSSLGWLPHRWLMANFQTHI